MTDVADTQAPLEAVLKDEILRMYQAVADQPEGTFHFFHGREAAELFEYEAEAYGVKAVMMTALKPSVP